MSRCAEGRTPRMPDQPHWLRGRVAVVTGASRGIGRATAEAMAQAGAHIVIAARGAGALIELAAAIRESGGTATPAPGHLSSADDVARALAIAHALRGATATVCAAGVLSKVPISQTILDT